MTTDTLCDFELEVLRKLDTGDDIDWGAAVGQALEALEGHHLISLESDDSNTYVTVTDKGRARLRRQSL